jgi:hypothetical protein
MTATDFRAKFEHVPGKTKPDIMTDGEIRQELKEAIGERRDALNAEVADRTRIRASDDQNYPVEPLLAVPISCHCPRCRMPDGSCDEGRNCMN